MNTDVERQRLLLDCFIDVADPAGLDQAAFLRRLVNRRTQLFAVEAAAVVLANGQSPPVIAASSRRVAVVAEVGGTDGGPTGESAAGPVSRSRTPT